MTIEQFGGAYRRARKSHICWCCGDAIQPGEKYFVTSGKASGKMFRVKHCRKTCECVGEMLDQNPQIETRLHAETLGKLT